MQQMTPKELQAYLVNENPVILDVREEWEFDICKLTNSINIPMGKLQNHINELNSEASYVMVCHHGVRSLQMAHYLEQAGFTKIINLSGGVAAWANEIDPNMAHY